MRSIPRAPAQYEWAFITPAVKMLKPFGLLTVDRMKRRKNASSNENISDE